MIKLVLGILGLVGLVAVTSLAIAALLFQRNAGKYSYFSVTIDKHNRLSALAPPRIIIVGGSSVAFGIDSPQIEKQLGTPVVNMGVQGAIGLRYMLAEIMPELKPGDIVLLSPEYHQFYGYLDGKDLLLDLLMVYPQGLQYLSSPRQFQTLVEGFPVAVQDMFRDKLDRVVFGDRPLLDAIYNRTAFDAEGDVVSHLDQPSLDVSKLSFGLDDKLDNEAITVVREFAVRAQRKGARVFFLFPAVPKTHFPKIQNQARTVCRALRGQNDLALLIAPQEAVLPDNWFYNTVYHLNRQGRDTRTKQIIDVLERGLISVNEPECEVGDK